jgi:hypothetical protein
MEATPRFVRRVVIAALRRARSLRPTTVRVLCTS